MAVDISVKPSWKKLYLKILMRETCLGFFNIEEFYQSCNFGCFWWIFSNIKPTYCAYQNLCMPLTTFLVFLLNISTSWKKCAKEQWPKKSHHDDEGGIYLGPWNHDRWLSWQRTHKFEYISVVGEQIRSLSSKQPKLNFWNQLHPKIAFLCRTLTQTATWRSNHTILTSNIKSILKAMIHTIFFGTMFRRVIIFY